MTGAQGITAIPVLLSFESSGSGPWPPARHFSTNIPKTFFCM
jgi:hypothetical protein